MLLRILISLLCLLSAVSYTIGLIVIVTILLQQLEYLLP